MPAWLELVQLHRRRRGLAAVPVRRYQGSADGAAGSDAGGAGDDRAMTIGQRQIIVAMRKLGVPLTRMA